MLTTGNAVCADGRIRPVRVDLGPGEARSGTVCGTAIATASALEAEAERRRQRELHRRAQQRHAAGAR